MDRLLSATGTEISSRAPMGAYLGVVPPPDVTVASPDLEKRLRAFGYADEP
jgi:hypothetical protein